MTEPWVSVDQVAAHLGITKDTVYRWIETESLPAQRVGRLWKFKLRDVDRWVAAGKAYDARFDHTNKFVWEPGDVIVHPNQTDESNEG